MFMVKSALRSRVEQRKICYDICSTKHDEKSFLNCLTDDNKSL